MCPFCHGLSRWKTKKMRILGLISMSILQEVHTSLYAMHPKGNKMYQDLRELYWWPGLKQKVTDFIAKCLTCQQVQAKHQFTFSLL
ncbi:zinc finger and BTB domain-containing protein 11-like [Gossypium australe]|uniref:Zinc finger and BTB domain-containing protein 11-like n=1 Tax=Gossypium australe TaxID=47621 RepID=A0A5B6WT33_9ROSI|nr:zinc finger and BTB domain-containing protein 11-like [Gossypium australe]